MFQKLLSFFLTLLLILSGFNNPSLSHAQDAKEYTLAVLDLVGYEVSAGEAKGLSDKLRSHITQLTKSERYMNLKDKDTYIVVERTQMDKIFDQFDIQNIECVSDSCAIEFGKMLQVDRIIIGSISLIGATYSIIARTVDVETGKTINSVDRQYRGKIDDVLSTVIPEVGDELISGVRKKSHKKWYVLGGAVIAGGIAALFMIPSNDNGTIGTIVIDVLLPE